MTNTVISVENLTKRYDLGVIGTGTLSRDLNRWWARLRHQPDPYTRIGQEDRFKRIGQSILALDDVSFTVQQGEALGIIGKNGAGKSTLLKILSRVTAPTSGVVKVKGRIGSLLEVGTGFHPELTGRENVFLNGAILGMRKEEVQKKFDEIVDFSGVEKFIDTPVKRYSSGMYVRLAFAVAAHLDPEILVVDEVLAVGDAEFQKKCLGKMGDVAGEGRTVLFVSHNMTAIETLCKRCVHLENGEIAAISNDVTRVIRQYTGPNTSTNQTGFSVKEVITEYFRVVDFKLYIKDSDLNTNTFSRSDDIVLETVLDVFGSYSSLSIGYALIDIENEHHIWWSFNIDKNQMTLKQGRNKLTTTIPQGLLNTGHYRIELIAGIHNQQWLLSPGASEISKEFSIQGGVVGSVSFSTTNRPTTIMPLFDWSKKYLGHDK